MGSPGLQPAEARFTSLDPYETLVANCDRQVATGDWNWSCAVPAVSAPTMFNGDCTCDGRILRHTGTGSYRCEKLPETCGDVSFEETLGYPPNLDWYDVYMEPVR